MTPLFVTGTDTGVGKTRVATAIVAAWRRQGYRVAVMKPVETGCALQDGALFPADAHALREAAGLRCPLALICPFRYPAPASPETAARLAGWPAPDLRTIQRALAELSAQAERTLLEGAGGLLVPLAADWLTVDLVTQLGARLLVVARTGLGTINHTLLTLAVARQRGIPVVGVILNRTAPPSGPEEALVAERIERHGQAPVLGTLPYQPDPRSHRELVDLAATHLALDALS